jgi:DNA-binding MarR family transcriptional regulator
MRSCRGQLSRGDCTTAPVVRYNCGVVNDSVDDTELERLLTQLLRVVSPAPAGETPGPARAAGGSDASVLPADLLQAGLPAVSASEARALIELISARGIAQGELAGLLGLEKSTVSRLAAGLERKGWVRRGRDGENQRYVRLYLTPEGRAVAVRVWGAWQSRQARILGALSAEERAGLSAGLRGLVRGLAAEGLLGEAPGNGRG